MRAKIPLTVIVTTLNEEKNIARCLSSLARFDEVIVVDSGSIDATKSIAQEFGAYFFDFRWNGQYPKKRQWCLDNLPLKHDYVFFVDADEEVTPALVDEIEALEWGAGGYFVKGLYVSRGKTLHFGLSNEKLCLFDRRKMHFPVVDDLDIPALGEIEGHYQPVFKAGAGIVRHLKKPVLHHALDDPDAYADRHILYAHWRKMIDARDTFPADPVSSRHRKKEIFKKLPFRRAVFFVYYYFVRGGIFEFRDHGVIFRQKCRYYGI